MTTIFNVRPRTTNIGNDVIAVATCALMERALGASVNLVSLPAIASGGGTLGSGLSARNIYEMNQLADGVVVGGGNLFENGALNLDANALGSLTTPMMLFSVSTGRIYGRTGALAPRTDSMPKERMQLLCRRSDPILVRDRATAAHLEAIGVDRVQVAGCPTLLLEEILPNLPQPSERLADTVLISVRHPRLMSIPYSLQGRMHGDVRWLIDFARGKGHDSVRLVCHDYQDLAFAAAFPDVPVLYTEDPLRFLAWVKGARLNITYRLHAFLPCLSYGTPSINISYDERAVSLIDTAGLAEWDIDMLRTPDLRGAVADRYANLSRLAALREAARPVWHKLRATLTDGFADFAGRVDAYRHSRVF